MSGLFEASAYVAAGAAAVAIGALAIEVIHLRYRLSRVPVDAAEAGQVERPAPTRFACMLLPIADAPKDGSLVLVLEWFRDEWRDIGPARFERDPRVLCGGDPSWLHDEHGEPMTPTHWLPWPGAPAGAPAAHDAGELSARAPAGEAVS